MIIECPECGEKNQTALPPQPGKRYRCGKCGASITFLQTADIQKAPTQILKEKTQTEKQDEVKKAKDEIIKRRTRIGCAAIVIIAAIVLIISLLAPGDNSEEYSPTATPIKVTAQALYEAYEENEVAADAKYDDKILEVRGIVESIGKDILDTPYIKLTSGAEYEVWGVQCMFDEKHESELARLTKGQITTIQGRCSGYLINVIVRDCVLVR